MSKAPSKRQWETLIRHLAADSVNVLFTEHAEARMKKRHITRLHVLDALRHGVIKREPETDLKTGDIQCRMERMVAGRNLGVVLALDGPSAATGIVITALLITDRR